MRGLPTFPRSQALAVENRQGTAAFPKFRGGIVMHMVGVNSYGYCDRICVALLLNFIFPFLIPSLPTANLTRMESIVLSLAIAVVY